MFHEKAVPLRNYAKRGYEGDNVNLNRKLAINK